MQVAYNTAMGIFCLENRNILNQVALMFLACFFWQG